MVSLGVDQNYRNTVEGTSGEQPRDGDTNLLIPETDEVAFWDMSGPNGFPSLLTGEDDVQKFHSIRNIPFIILIITLVLLNAVFSFVIPVVCPEKCGNNVVSFHIIAYIQVGLFLALFLLDLLLQKMHFKSRSGGYLEFYRKSRQYRRSSWIIFSIGTATFLLLTVITEALCTDLIHCHKYFSRSNAAQIICCLEAAFILPICARYIYISHLFNTRQASPDVLQEDLSTERILQTSINYGNQVGFKDKSFKEDLLEKQADEILYLKKRNAFLSSRILHLTRQINSLGETSAA